MRILILNWRDPNNPKSGGAEAVTIKHAGSWVKSGHSVVWLTSSHSQLNSTDNIDGVKIIRKCGTFTIYLFAPFYVLANHKQIDLIIDQVHGIPFFTPLYTRKKIIVFVHEVAGEIWDSMFAFPINLIGKMLEKLYLLIYRNYKFWTVSESTAQDLIKNGISKNNITIIKSAIDNVEIKNYKKEKFPTYIYVSRLVKMKGIEDVIDAFSLISKKQTKSKLWIVGAGEKKYTKSLLAKVKSLNLEKKVKFWGYVSDSKKYELLKRSHILLHASKKEGWGLVIMEAASCGVPAVVYDSSGLRESVIHNKTGIVINKNLPEQLAQDALSLYGNKLLFDKLKINCMKQARMLTWEKSTAQSIALINSIYE
ncbi:glycosyltransferase family 4 protein [Patescibacteria group bacterium]